MELYRIKNELNRWAEEGFVKRYKTKEFKQLYQKGEKLGSGQFGTVYAGIQRETDTPVAIKTIRLSGNKINPLLLRTEIEALKLLQKDCEEHVVKYIDVIYHPSHNRLYMIMELLEGIELYDYEKETLWPKEQALNEEDVWPILNDLITGLICMHKNGVSHRDIKPENVMVDENGTRAKWVDLGLSCVVTCYTGLVGSPLYIAPEIMLNTHEKTIPLEHWKNADVWSLGMLAYELITSRTFDWEINEDETYRTNEQLIEIFQNVPKRLISESLRAKFPRVCKLIEASLIPNPRTRKQKWQNYVVQNYV